MSEINKTINYTKKVVITLDDESKIDVAFLSCQIGTEYNTFSTNIQIINNEYYSKNKELVKSEYLAFKELVEREAEVYGF